MIRLSILVVGATALSLVNGCSYAERVAGPQTITASQADTPNSELDVLKQQYARPLQVPFPADNVYSEEKRLLGQALFFDPRLSTAGNISCASCHNPALAWADGLPVGIGHKANKLGRHSPTILDIAWAPALFWDGRADTLEQQASGPMLADAEMGMNEKAVLDRVNATPGYRPMFDAAFPEKGVSLATITAAIATFERTVVSGKAPFDRWVEGDETAIGDGAKRGFVTFNKKANCAACHSGWRFTNDGFQDIGLPGNDLGRGKLVSDVPELQHAFKTPTLRNISRRAPYMHDGGITTLEAVIRHYERDFIKRDSLSADMKTYTLTDEERADLLAFLITLTSDDPQATVPALPR